MTYGSAFRRFGNGHRFSSKKPLGQAIFEQFVETNGGVWEKDGNLGAKWFADAMAIARCQSTLERAANQADPRTAHDLVRALEGTYGIVPDTDATRALRREALYQAQRLTLGPVRPNVEAQLAAALGADFVAWVTEDPEGENDFPNDPKPWENNSIDTLGPYGALGIFDTPPSWKIIRFLNKVKGVETREGMIEVHWEHVAGDEGPLIPRLASIDDYPEIQRKKPDLLIVDPGKLGLQEVIVVQRTFDATHFGAYFGKTHEGGALAWRWPWPYWLSIQKHSFVVVKNGRALDRKLRDKANRLLHKLLGATSTWDIVEENETPGSAGPFIPGQGKPGITPIKQITW